MKRFDGEEVKLIGMRLKSARALTGFSQSDFCEKYNLSVGAFKTWESGKFVPRLANLQELCSCLEKEGIFNATTSWFLRGEGPAPTHVKGNTIEKSSIFLTKNDKDIQEEIELFTRNQQKQQKQIIISVVSDDLMSPYFSKGDIVGGVKFDKMSSISQITNKPCLIEIKENAYLLSWCFSDGTDIFFKYHNSDLMYRVETKRIGLILWHRRLN